MYQSTSASISLLGLTVSDTSAFETRVSWNSTDNVTSYSISDGTTTYTTSATTYVLSNLSPATTYTISVRANRVRTPSIISVTTNVLEILVTAGQSNAQGCGRSLDANIDIGNSRIWQYSIGDTWSRNSFRSNTISLAVEPLDDGPPGTDQISHNLAFARLYTAANPMKTLLLVNIAVNGAGFSLYERSWLGPRGNIYQRAFKTMSDLHTLYPNASLLAIDWIQGEVDVGMTELEYRTELVHLFSEFRTRFPQATSSTPICVMSMVPENIAKEIGTQAIDGVHRLIPHILPYTSYAAGPIGYSQDYDIHYNAAGQRVLGSILHTSLPIAMSNASPIPTALDVWDVKTTLATISWKGVGDSYNVFYTSDGDTLLGGTATARTFTLSGLSANTTYSVFVTAQNNGVDSSNSAQSTFTTLSSK